MALPHFGSPGQYLPIAMVLLLLSALPGCGLGNKGKGEVSGIVTYKGEPVSAGTVSFYGSNNEAASALIGEDGSYHAAAVPVGEVSVTVTTPRPRPTPAEVARSPFLRRRGVQGSTEKTVTLPGKYGKTNTSGLRLTVSEGSQTFDITLK